MTYVGEVEGIANQSPKKKNATKGGGAPTRGPISKNPGREKGG